MRTKIYNKSKAWWKHGKHKGLQGHLEEEKRNAKKKKKMKPLDLRKSGWSNTK